VKEANGNQIPGQSLEILLPNAIRSQAKIKKREIPEIVVENVLLLV
jgi:hypothetical protein